MPSGLLTRQPSWPTHRMGLLTGLRCAIHRRNGGVVVDGGVNADVDVDMDVELTLPAPKLRRPMCWCLFGRLLMKTTPNLVAFLLHRHPNLSYRRLKASAASITSQARQRWPAKASKMLHETGRGSDPLRPVLLFFFFKFPQHVLWIRSLGLSLPPWAESSCWRFFFLYFGWLLL